jgi:SAM-dependent methyltransferase
VAEAARVSELVCRGCAAPLVTTFVDLGMQPLSNAYVEPERAFEPQTYYPLHVFVCDRCLLVQVPAFERREEIFNDAYAYYSSYSDSWLAHSERYAEATIARLGLGARSSVVEIASNDGYLLQYFVRRGIPVLGIDPSGDVAQAAIARGVPTEVAFFGAETASAVLARDGAADLMAANNVLAHVPDLHDFVEGFARLLAADGAGSFEFPHLLRLIDGALFDTIYQEHYSYLSLVSLEPVLRAHGLEVWAVEELPTHGGSLRVWFGHRGAHPIEPSVEAIRAAEHAAGLDALAGYGGFAERVRAICDAAVRFLSDAARDGKTVAAYGAAAKGNTFLNTAGVRRDAIAFVADRNTAKQGRLMPGTRIPIVAPERIDETRPDYVVILPWNIRDEVAGQLEGIGAWGGRFVTFVPEPTVWPA